MKHDIRNGPSSNHAQFSFDSFLLLRWRDISQIEHTQDCSQGRQILWARDWVRRNGPTFLLKQPCVNKRRCSVSVAFPLLFGWFETSPISRYNRCRYVGIFSHRFFLLFVANMLHATVNLAIRAFNIDFPHELIGNDLCKFKIWSLL